jgi:predicted lipid-binding transport protein (Tim44 family)
MGHASGEDPGGGGIGFLDMILLGLLLYFLWRFIKRRRAPAGTSGYNGHGGDGSAVGGYGSARADSATYAAGPYGAGSQDAIRRGFEQIFRTDPGFDANALRDLVQDIFFRVQAGWMNRSLEGILDLLTPEMARDFAEEFDGMKHSGRTNRLENIAVRRVEPAEVWQEGGKDYITVLFAANLLDYTTDDATGEVVEGDRLNPVRFEEYWTFCRDIGSPHWQLSAIQQAHEPAQRFH